MNLQRNRIFTVPNILSFFRILLIPFMAICYVKEEHILNGTLILVSAMTDVVDGWIARHFHMVSSLGKALDPIADKLTLLVLLVCRAFSSAAMLALLAVFVLKETIMGIEGLLIIRETGTTYSALCFGKLTTVFLYLTLFTHAVWPGIPDILSHISVGICILRVLFSLILYTRRNIRELRKETVSS